MDCEIDKSPDQRRRVFPSPDERNINDDLWVANRDVSDPIISDEGSVIGIIAKPISISEECKVRTCSAVVFPWSKIQATSRALKAGKHFGTLVLRPD